MRNRFFYLTLLLTVLFVPSFVKANEGMYAGVLGGLNLLQKDHYNSHNIKYKTGYAVGAFAGYEIRDDFRLEGEFTYRRNDIKKVSFEEERSRSGHRRSFSLMANVIYDIDLTSMDVCVPVTPYIGVGLGADWDRLATSISDQGHKSRKARFAAQGIAGVAYPVCENVQMTVDYRYHWAMHHRYNHTFALGLKQGF